MDVIVVFIAFLCGVLIGLLLAAAFYAAPTVDPVQTVAEAVVEPAPVPVPDPEPVPVLEVVEVPTPTPVEDADPVEGRYTCVLVDGTGTQESVRRMAYLPPAIHRYHGRKTHKTYTYDRIDAEGRHIFTLVTHGR